MLQRKGSSTSSGSDATGELDGQNPAPRTPAKQASEDGPYSYFNVPWSLSFNYNFNYSKSGNRKAIVTQSLSFSGNIKLSEKWTTSFSSGYDFEAHGITHTSFNITRDLHCWQMSMGFSPFGIYKYYAFKINVNSSILRDLKYDQKKDRREYETW